MLQLLKINKQRPDPVARSPASPQLASHAPSRRRPKTRCSTMRRPGGPDARGQSVNCECLPDSMEWKTGRDGHHNSRTDPVGSTPFQLVEAFRSFLRERGGEGGKRICASIPG